MVVKCIRNKQFPTRLTLDKTYEVLKVTMTCYIIRDDRGTVTWYGKSSFMEV